MSTTGRKACTSGQHCDPRNMGEVLYCLVHHSTIDARTIAERLGVRYSYLLDAANPDRDEAQFQARLVIPITVITQNDALVRYICAEVGGMFVRLPKVDAAHSDVTLHAAEILREVADVIQAPSQVLEDNKVSADEFAKVDKEVDEAVRSLLAFRALMRTKAGLDERPGTVN